MTGPQLQEKKVGNELLDLGNDVHAEASVYNGNTYASIRRWFRADDGKWYRTKNGLHIKLEHMTEVLAHMEEIIPFFLRRGRELNGNAEPVGEERNVTPGAEQPGEDVPF